MTWRRQQSGQRRQTRSGYKWPPRAKTEKEREEERERDRLRVEARKDATRRRFVDW